MPISQTIWKVADEPAALTLVTLASEQQLESMIVTTPQILSNEWMLIGRQEQTGLGGRIDLLAIAPDASLVLIELKRNRTPREIVAQALDYASWVERLTAEKIAQIYHRFSGGENLNEAFKRRFRTDLDEEVLNESHQIIIVAAELDDSTERIISYLNERDVAINVMYFQIFQHGSEQLLSRAWLIDPRETQANVAATTKGKREAEPWNGEFYVSYGGEGRSWDDARKYGFVSAGGGSWYSQTLKQLSPNDRIWVKIPQTGYVGVGRVVEPMQSAKDFMVRTNEGDQPCVDALQNGMHFRKTMNDPDMGEYFVRVRWLDTVTESEAVSEVGLFGNQNTVCRPTTPKWRHTVERLKSRFPKWDS